VVGGSKDIQMNYLIHSKNNGERDLEEGQALL
jgi:hypothetical protein